MKVIFCWAGISGYMAACWRELERRSDINTSLLCRASSIPWSSGILERLPVLRTLTRQELGDDELIHELVVARQPDVVVLPGWTYRCFNGLPFYRDLAHCRFILAMDNPWQGTWRQRFARLKVGALLDRMDAVAVAGERCYQFARHLGVPEAKILRGTYGIDFDHFSAIHQSRLSASSSWPRRFLFTGRFAKEKGLDVLIKAYKAYRQRVVSPWPLSCCGRGSLEPMLQSVEGVENHGFVQPSEMGAMYANAGVFVLPSHFDPWPLAVVEASAAGLPVICTEACGSAVETVRSFYSGLVVPTDNVDAFRNAMTWVHNHHDLLPQYGSRASQFAAAYSAQAWADRWTERFTFLMA